MPGASRGSKAETNSAAVVVDGEVYALPRDRPLVFGRVDADGVLGLDERDMGISGEAGSIEWAWNLWWVVNRSRKRHLLLDVGTGGAPQRLECGHRFAVPVAHLSILVPGEIFTHRLDLAVPESELARYEGPSGSSGTTTTCGISLSERDKDVVVALFSGYLEEYPRRRARPRSYRSAAELLGDPWTELTVRKQVERLKERLARSGTYIEGPDAKYDLADHLIANGLLCPEDLRRLDGCW